MNGNEPLKPLAEYGRLHPAPAALSIFEFLVAGLPTALYLAQAVDAQQAVAFGCKCLVVFLITGLFRHGCGWSTRPTLLASVVLFLPALVWVYHAAVPGPPPNATAAALVHRISTTV